MNTPEGGLPLSDLQGWAVKKGLCVLVTMFQLHLDLVRDAGTGICGAIFKPGAFLEGRRCVCSNNVLTSRRTAGAGKDTRRQGLEPRE